HRPRFRGGGPSARFPFHRILFLSHEAVPDVFVHPYTSFFLKNVLILSVRCVPLSVLRRHLRPSVNSPADQVRSYSRRRAAWILSCFAFQEIPSHIWSQC